MRRIIPLGLILVALVGAVAGFEVTRNTSQIIPPAPPSHGCGVEWITGKPLGVSATYSTYLVTNHEQNFTVLSHYYARDHFGNVWNDSMSVRIDGNQSAQIDFPNVSADQMPDIQ